MRRSFVVALAVLAILGMLAPPSFAQAPAPKVTINGLIDFVVTAYANTSQNGGQDVTSPVDRGFMSRQRGVFTLTGEVGKTKGVWAIELDFMNGAGSVNSGNAFNGGGQSVTHTGISANFDLDTDVASAIETKWLFLETPITGPGSLMPFIPVTTIGRFGGQPARGHTYGKVGILFSGDFPGANFVTTWAPNVRSTLTWVQIAEAIDRVAAPGQKESFAILASVEVDVFKGLTVKPTYAYASYNGGNCGTNNLGTENFGGISFNTNCGAAPGSGGDIRRHYFGGDARWTSGPFYVEPTVLFMRGDEDVPAAGGRKNVDINAYIVDTTAGFRAGPLNIEARAMYTPGVGANHILSNGGGGTDRRYTPINSGFGYMSGWSEIWKSNIEYNNTLMVSGNGGGLVLRQSPSYDKYGRVWFALAVDYSLTPALTLKGLTNVSWTDTKVDTTGFLAPGVTGITTRGIRGTERYLGNEWNLGFTYRFAPNVTFDLVGAILIVGDALNHARAAGGPVFQAHDVYKGAARLRLTF
jgi:hypothetical protein